MKKETSPIIFGIDPGTRSTGYGIIQAAYPRMHVLDFGCIRPPPHLDTAQKYLTLFNALDLLLEKYSPDYVVVESQFVYKNVQSALKLGKAQGMALLAAARRSICVREVAPKKAKLAVCGNGSASKQQVQKMIQLLLHLPSLPQPEDAADALALAIALAHSLTHPLGKNYV
ncbi:MAG TPA: crossover junction endodeoxyribonuclease RuvC [Rhabdochlamydiaceae bacterium]|jgi:crossover junction endodeoxyribonuclease RuvC